MQAEELSQAERERQEVVSELQASSHDVLACQWALSGKQGTVFVLTDHVRIDLSIADSPLHHPRPLNSWSPRRFTPPFQLQTLLACTRGAPCLQHDDAPCLLWSKFLA